MAQDLSVVIPVHNEAPNIDQLHRELHQILSSSGHDYELVFVDDGSNDTTLDQLKKLRATDSHIKIIRFRRNFGQTAAFAAGFAYASGAVIVTMDGDLQNDPADIPRLIARLEDGHDVVCGWRRERHDNVLKVMPSRLANWLIRQITGLTVHDIGCTLRVYRAGVIKAVAHSGLQHRYIPIQCQALDASLVEVETNHRTRRTGQSKYGLRRIFTIIRDLPMLYAMAHSKDCARPDKTDQLRNLVKDIYRKNCITQPLRDASTDPEKISNGA